MQITAARRPATARYRWGVLRRETFKFLLLALRHNAFLILEHKMAASDNHAVFPDVRGDAVSHNVVHLGMHFFVNQPRRIDSFTTAFAME